MVFEEAGTYKIEYTATDDCGNTTTAERTVIVEAPPTYRTVLYTDGTFIINESEIDEAHNIELHGAATNVYAPFDPNGATNVERYVFASISDAPWVSERRSVLSVEIGSNISPTSTAHWFEGFEYCTGMDLSNLNTSLVVNMQSMFNLCTRLTSLDLSNFNTHNVTDMANMFAQCNALTALDLSNFDTSNVIDMSAMFYDCWYLSSLDISSFNTSNVTNMQEMFYEFCTGSLTTLDLSGFDTSKVKIMSSMFYGCFKVETIYVSNLFVVTQVTSSSNMFKSCSRLVGGAGTTYDASYIDKTRAKIDGGVSDPGYFTAKN